MLINKKRTEHYPFIIVTTLLSLSIWFFLRGFYKYISLWLIQWGKEPMVIPLIIGQPLKTPFHLELLISAPIFIIMWILSTKVQLYQKMIWRIFTVSVMYFGIVFQLLWNGSAPIVRSLIPFLYDKKEMIYMENMALEQALLANTDNLMLFLLSIPLIMSISVTLWLLNFCNQHWKDIIERFKTWEYSLSVPSIASLFMTDEKKRKTSSKIRQFFDQEKKKTIPLPDIELGANTKSGEMVILRGKDRTLNNLIIGSIGTGKTSALVLPMINQDLHYMTYMINNFKALFAKGEKYHTEDIKGSLLNGITVIEPSKDLCDKVYELVLAHGIPKEAVYYIDPTNPDTPSLNLFNAPVDKVAEMFTMVIEGVGEKQEFFFQQSQRAHLKMHIYLLMLHDPDKKASFENLIEMYNDAQLVARMHLALKETIPEDINQITDRDERNHWLIVKGVDEWFNETYVSEKQGFGANQKDIEITSGPYRGDKKMMDKKSEHVVGLRNILNDIASNILMRRVLFGESNFDFDKHLEYGGILLVNTAKGDLSELSDILGKFVLLSMQNAVFRRKPNLSAYHSLYVDEFPDYINDSFKSFPAQSRKYKAIVTVVAQTTSQLSHKYGSSFMQTLISTLRNKYLYGDTTQEDAEMFSSIYGEKIVFDEGESDQEVSPLMESPIRRTGKTYMERKMPVLSPSELIYQDAFVCAVKLVDNNKPLPAQQILANFVPREEFKKAIVTVDKEAGAYWINVRESQMSEEWIYQDIDGAVDDVLSEKESNESHFVTDENLLDQSSSTDSLAKENIELPIYKDVAAQVSSTLDHLETNESNTPVAYEVSVDSSTYPEINTEEVMSEEELQEFLPSSPGSNSDVENEMIDTATEKNVEIAEFTEDITTNVIEDPEVPTQQEETTLLDDIFIGYEQHSSNSDTSEPTENSKSESETVIDDSEATEEGLSKFLENNESSTEYSISKNIEPNNTDSSNVNEPHEEGTTNNSVRTAKDVTAENIKNQNANSTQPSSVATQDIQVNLGVQTVPMDWFSREKDEILEKDFQENIEEALKQKNTMAIQSRANRSSSNVANSEEMSQEEVDALTLQATLEAGEDFSLLDSENAQLDNVVRNAQDPSRFSRQNLPVGLASSLARQANDLNLDSD
ncbi:TraM recognition domain-containing protein [Pseudobacillus badius]|uniref:type IV secretory system conjugative DNA transfer family protein n=1 Tax=Bacillus badius TaxID=1455 RepID=UPI003D3393BA